MQVLDNSPNWVFSYIRQTNKYQNRTPKKYWAFNTITSMTNIGNTDQIKATGKILGLCTADIVPQFEDKLNMKPSIAVDEMFPEGSGPYVDLDEVSVFSEMSEEHCITEIYSCTT